MFMYAIMTVHGWILTSPKTSRILHFVKQAVDVYDEVERMGHTIPVLKLYYNNQAIKY